MSRKKVSGPLFSGVGFFAEATWLIIKGREQGAGSREQGAGSREQGAGSREGRWITKNTVY
jgi:hypothetical protein